MFKKHEPDVRFSIQISSVLIFCLDVYNHVVKINDIVSTFAHLYEKITNISSCVESEDVTLCACFCLTWVDPGITETLGVNQG